MLGTHSPQDWEVLRAEVLAEHGYVFYRENDLDDDQSGEMSWEDLQHYFDDRYWYRPDPRFDAGQLSIIERQNLDTIVVALTRQLGRAVSPGMMNLFARNALTEQTLVNVSIADLRLLRNEVYAGMGASSGVRGCVAG